MSSAAMNANGVIAVGYAVSSTQTFPSLRFAFRLPSDPLGQLRDEVSFFEGAGSQTGTNRYGDYFALSVDPANDRAFWFTGEYYGQTSSSNWSTRVGVIRIDGVEAATAAAPEAGALGGAALSVSEPYPNPAANAATVTVSVGTAQRVRVEVVGPLGRRLAVLHDGLLEAGEHAVRAPVEALAPGLYLLRVQGAHETVTRRLLVVR